MIAKICAGGKIVQKYRLRKYAEMVFGFSKKRWKHSDKDPHTFTRKRTTRTADALKSCVRLFFERDDVSRLTTGRKQTKTKSKLKNQKRFLMDTMRNVQRKFLAEYPNRLISYSLFCQLRPFWVVNPTLSERDTCLCEIHENLGFVANKLQPSEATNTLQH